MNKVRITEYLNVDLEKEMWCCNRCGADIISAREPYFKGCLVYDRPGSEVYGPPTEIAQRQFVNYAPDPRFQRILEFYCPTCGTMVEVQYLPPGHPIPVDIALDIDKMKERYLKGQR
ncbi:MAG: acetone carboxylase subunit gamma [Syntrophorhabdales bacterium]|jgi:acetone carboxylase gamma subunit